MSDDEKKVKLALLQVAELEKSCRDSYPYWRRGVLTGVIGLGLTGGGGIFLATLSGRIPAAKVIVAALIFGATCFVWGAFRPKK